MKRAILVFLSLTLICASSQAQKLLLGGRIGAFVDYTMGKSLAKDLSGTFLVGGFVGIRGHKFGITAEANFFQSTVTTGDNFKDAFNNYLSSSASSIDKGTFKLDELSIPLLLNIKLLPSFWLQLGPQYTAIVNIKDKNDFVQSTQEVFKSNVTSAVVGVWIDFSHTLSLSARYAVDITNLNNTTVDQSWRSGKAQLALGINFL